MKRLAMLTAATGMAVALAAPAAAAPFITIITGSGTYGDNSLTCAPGATLPCTFTDTFTFTTPTGFNLVSLTLNSAIVGGSAATDVNFTSVTFNGVNFNILSSGAIEFRNLLNQVISAGGTNTISVSGTTGGSGSFAGSLSFANVPVPEAATWAMMLAGFGAMGTMMRRRKTSVSFA